MLVEVGIVSSVQSTSLLLWRKSMDLKTLQDNWNNLGETDPLWAVLSDPHKQDKKWQINDFFIHGEKEIENVMKYIKSLGITVSSQKALDFGCGVGRLTQALAQYFDQVYGVDIAPSMIELAKQYNRYENKCLYYLNDTNKLELFADESFDFVYTKITLQHVKPEYSKNYIKEFLRILAPKGLLIFQIPSEQTILGKLRASIVSIMPKALSNLYRRSRYGTKAKMEMYGIKREEVINLIAAHGADVLDVKQDKSAGKQWISFQYCIFKKEKDS